MEKIEIVGPIAHTPGLLQETTKAQRVQFVDSIIGEMEEGNLDPLKVHLQLKGTESLIEMFTDKKKHAGTAERYNELLLEAAVKYGAKTFELHNASFLIKEAGVQYDWSTCNDPVLTDLIQQQERLKQVIKERQDFLKTLPYAGIEWVNPDDGEVVTLYPPAKTSTTVLQTTLK